jgi:SAM-dependent methyltransferase
MLSLYRTALASAPWMYRCAVCGFCQASPLPVELGGEYEDAYTASAEAERKNRRLAPDYLRKIRPHLPPSPFRFLEVGGAHGWLAQAVREKCGADVLLLEPGRSAVAAAQSRGLPAQVGYLESFQSAQPFDVLCAAHVIEHVADAGKFFAACQRVLRPGGTLILMTPNAAAWKLARFRHLWAWAVPEQHTLFLSADSAVRLLARHGFQPVAIHSVCPAFAHYPFFVARWLAEWRARHALSCLRWFTRPLAMVEFVLLRCTDAWHGIDRADELLIVGCRV